ncbi:MAG: bifunctional 23S rRNA (guanine(2069)-N(7))-methyltransferase RlmK/23S rRNA (guanine(2445)-N(2))-methyltransferase RlmL [Acidobacteria bacterium]|nr:bifunctional 23S rRNA (guanine(2069)-N(7))-methyltransferase RlmK/23S rRNA (guanine(2445)-N(2))-methyltransferase RlmL [Acidobacteriota bacterium]|tara:strand:- start:17028 stop:19148 length:2121 start_codon:yes stop_codon:yes gene_type:complete
MDKFFAVTARGTEQVLAEELHEIGIVTVEALRGGVGFEGNLTEAYLACLWSRVASRILLPIHTFEAFGASDLYDGVSSIDWTLHLDATQTLAVDVAGKNASAGPGHFITLKAKDAIVDRIRQHGQSRPNIDSVRPDVRVNLHVRGPKVTVNIDLSGRGLHRRGFDRVGTEAPLKENLAAAILRLAGWTPKHSSCPLFDPMCGSGTILMEAAWMALNVAPGINRKHRGDKGWRGHDLVLWERLRQQALERSKAAAGETLLIAGTDRSDQAISYTCENLKRAGLESAVQVEKRDLSQVTHPFDRPGILITNPPYGERLGNTRELGPLYELLGDTLKRRFPGWQAWILSGNQSLTKRIGLRSRSKHIVFNGPIESKLLEIPISAKRIAGELRPGWRRPSKESQGLLTRLQKNLRKLRPWATRGHLTCYRLYDAEVPHYNVAIDWYDGWVRIEEYLRPSKIPQRDADQHLFDTRLVVEEALEINSNSIVLRVAETQAASPSEKDIEGPDFLTIDEGGSRFKINIESHWEPGLRLEERSLRARIQKQSLNSHFLNLFAYTCTASVAAAIGGAESSVSVDSSQYHLDWGQKNFLANDIALPKHQFIRAEVEDWLSNNQHDRYDLILVSSRTSLGSQYLKTEEAGLTQTRLLQKTCSLLSSTGELLFVTAQRTFRPHLVDSATFRISDITTEITSRDFKQRPLLKAWSVRRSI